MKKINKPTKKQVNVTLYIVGVIALVTLGVVGTLKYQEFIGNVKAEGVAEFKIQSCDPYANDKGQKWLECDE